MEAVVLDQDPGCTLIHTDGLVSRDYLQLKKKKPHMSRIQNIEPVSTHLSSKFFARKKNVQHLYKKKKLVSQGTMVKPLWLGTNLPTSNLT